MSKIKVFSLKLAFPKENEKESYSADGTGELLVKEEDLGCITSELKASEPGVLYVVSIQEMDEEEYNNFPEFDGF